MNNFFKIKHTFIFKRKKNLNRYKLVKRLSINCEHIETDIIKDFVWNINIINKYLLNWYYYELLYNCNIEFFAIICV